uniref:Zinc finger protein 414 n=1 Tax=Catharus ustulatus TaxID=91951 RepID=A0A8C3Y3F4_CATUS
MCTGVPGCAWVCRWHRPACSRHHHKAPRSSHTLGGSSLSIQTPQAPFPWRDGEGTGLVWQGRASQAVPAGCSDPALRSAPMPGSAGTPTPELRPLKRRPVPGEPSPARTPHVPFCKTFHCPTLGCTETFPSMQDLMVHMKVHYKPNRYFKCENCLLRFRTHRSLFKHLHVCSDSASGPAPPPKPDNALRPLEKEAADSAPGALPAALPGSLEPLVPPGPHPFPLLEPGLFGPSSLTRFSGPPPSSHRLRPFLPGHGPPQGWERPQGHCSAPRRAEGEGHSSNSRIVWEHTRGRYSCTQCPFSTASREDMTLHIEDHRKNPPPGRAGGTAQPLALCWDRQPSLGTGAPPAQPGVPEGPVFPLEFLPFYFIFGNSPAPGTAVSPSPKGFVASAPGALRGAQ